MLTERDLPVSSISRVREVMGEAVLARRHRHVVLEPVDAEATKNSNLSPFAFDKGSQAVIRATSYYNSNISFRRRQRLST